VRASTPTTGADNARHGAAYETVNGPEVAVSDLFADKLLLFAGEFVPPDVAITTAATTPASATARTARAMSRLWANG
jgi:hypothetical protein